MLEVEGGSHAVCVPRDEDPLLHAVPEARHPLRQLITTGNPRARCLWHQVSWAAVPALPLGLLAPLG